MGVFRRILIFLVITSGIILVGKLVPRWLPKSAHAPAQSAQSARDAGASGDALRDSTNALPPIPGDTTGGQWRQRLFQPLLEAAALPEKSLRRKPGYWELVFPQGKPIHEYALLVEKVCRRQGVAIQEGVELRPSNRSVEYHLEYQGRLIKLRASLGKAFMAGSARLAVLFIGLDSLRETQLAELEAAAWEKTLVVNAHAANPVLKKLRFTAPRNEILLELPMEPAAYPYVDPGKHALFIHHNRQDVERILSDALDSLPQARGFASRYGDRAIENLPLLDKLFQFNAGRGLLFLDLTGSPRSLARQAASAQGARARAALPYREAAVEEELGRKAALARKTGEALLVLPYAPGVFRQLAETIAANEERFNLAGLELVTFSGLSAAPADSARK